MRDKLQYIFAILVGSFALHCSSSAIHGNGDGGITDSHADTGTCCAVMPQTFKLIGEGDVALATGATFETPSFDVSQYRELVVSISSNATGGACYIQSAYTVFQEPGSTAFISTGQGLGRIRVDGPIARITGYASNITCTGSNAHYVVAGVSLN